MVTTSKVFICNHGMELDIVGTVVWGMTISCSFYFNGSSGTIDLRLSLPTGYQDSISSFYKSHNQGIMG